MLMGACNESQIFQQLVNEIFHDFMDEIVMVCIADFLIYSKTGEGHYKYLEVILKRLLANQLHVSLGKCKSSK